MSDDVDIRHGAVEVVDTASLRSAADAVDALGRELEDAAQLIRAARALIDEISPLVGRGLGDHAGELADEVDRADRAAVAIAHRLRRAAAIYEYAELLARGGATPDAAERDECARRMAVLRLEQPGVEWAAGADRLAYLLRAPWDLIGQAWMLGSQAAPSAGLAALLAAGVFTTVVRAAGLGFVPADARLVGPADPVLVTRVSRTSTIAVSSLAQAAQRIPDAASIRVEKYTMRDGTRQFVVYVAGTGSGPAFDMRSNAQLYSGQRSASSEAVRESLRRAGARRGDVLHEVGHSQGAMITDRIAIDGEFDVRTLVSFGSPIQADVSTSVLSVDVRHTDDLVSALADGGSATGVGSPDSFVAERTADPAVSAYDVRLPAHHLDAYVDTAALLDASADPRMAAVREVFSQLGDAISVEATEYTAMRPAALTATPMQRVSAFAEGAG